MMSFKAFSNTMVDINLNIRSYYITVTGVQLEKLSGDSNKWRRIVSCIVRVNFNDFHN